MKIASTAGRGYHGDGDGTFAPPENAARDGEAPCPFSSHYSNIRRVNVVDEEIEIDDQFFCVTGLAS